MGLYFTSFLLQARYKWLIEMQESSFCSTPQDGQAQKPLCNSVPRIMTPPLSKSCKDLSDADSQDSTGQKTKIPTFLQYYLYQISHFASRKEFQYFL